MVLVYRPRLTWGMDPSPGRLHAVVLVCGRHRRREVADAGHHALLTVAEDVARRQRLRETLAVPGPVPA